MVFSTGTHPARVLAAGIVLEIALAIAQPVRGQTNPKLDVSPSVLATLNDIGGMADVVAPFSVSPNNLQLAVVVRAADPTANVYRQELVVIDIGSAKVERILELDGDPVLQLNAQGRPIGTLETIVPQWSPDGTRLYVILNRDGAAQLVELTIATGKARQVSHVPGGILDFKLRRGGRYAFVRYLEANSPSPEVAEAERLRGYRYDDRWRPSSSNRPSSPRPLEKKADLTIAGGELIGLQEPEVTESTNQPNIADGEFGHARIEPVDPKYINSPVRVAVTDRRGVQTICPKSVCSDAEAIWWGTTNATLFVKRRTGWANSTSEIVSWLPGEQKGKILLRTADLISGCRAAGNEIICAIDGSDQPRRLVALNQITGDERIVFDPNPGWRRFRTGSVRRLHWRNYLGLEVIGDLVLPPEKQAGDKLPLIVVGYTTRGFLRGGTGDLVPILPLAAQGFAVLVVQNPIDAGFIEPVADLAEAIRRHFDNWSDRRSASDAILKGIELAVQTGPIDRNRIGITGFSNGSENAQFAMITNPDLFKAAAFYSCCEDPVAARIAFGPAMARNLVDWGYPKLDSGDRRTESSLAAHASQVKSPILLQVSDGEYLLALEAFSALTEAGKCISMYVHPDEYHIIWQPAHRLAIYDRTISWFKALLMRDQRTLPVSSMTPPNCPDLK